MSVAAETELVDTYRATGATAPATARSMSAGATTRPRPEDLPIAMWPNAGSPASWARSCRCRPTSSRPRRSSREDVAKRSRAGPTPSAIDAIQEYVDAGFDHVYVHQVGPDQDGFFRLYAEEVLPKVQ